MTQPTAANDPVARTLRPLLDRQLARLRGRYLWHGLGKATLCTAALVLLFFVLDRWLRLPTPIRLFHTACTAAVAAFCVARFVRYPLRRRFSEIDLALWLEHSYPELHQRLVSAIQLHDVEEPALRNQSRAMIEQLWQDTAATVAQLRFDELFDEAALRRTVGGGGLLAAGLVLAALLAPETAHTFALRHLGFQVDYPRETTLVVELPPGGPDLQRNDRDGETELVLPAGADLHVSVLALGVVPKEAFLDMRSLREGGEVGTLRSVPLTPRPGDRFRHVFRRLSGSFEFRARGGDDEQGDRRVVVRTVRPAQVATLRAEVTPPAYTGIERLEQTGGAIEALAQSRVVLTVEATAPVRQATMVFLEGGRRLELKPVQMQDDGGSALAFSGEFLVEGSDRYQIELLADNGLRNPNPGTYPISALQDYAPVGRWLLPEDDQLALLPSALLCLRVDARDDFGLTGVDLRIERSGQTALERALLAPAPAGEPVREQLLTELFELGDLLGKEAGNDGLFVLVTLRDNKQPETSVAELPRRIVQIVDPPQLAALIARSFRQLREEVQQAADVQGDRRARLQELVARPDAAAGEIAQILTGIEVGQSRVASAVQRVHRGLMRAFDLHLWNRLEPSQHAAAVVDLYVQHCRRQTEPLALDPAFYRDLGARRTAGTLGAMETTLDPILAMIDLVDRLAANSVPVLQRLCAEAQIARDAAERAPILAACGAEQERVEAALKELLLRLEEWNDYQDLVQEVRALRDRQRDLQSRTEEARGK